MSKKRVTIYIDETLWRNLRLRGFERGKSASELVESAIESLLSRGTNPDMEHSNKVYIGHGETKVHFEDYHNPKAHYTDEDLDADLAREKKGKSQKQKIISERKGAPLKDDETVIAEAQKKLESIQKVRSYSKEAQLGKGNK